MNQDQKKVVQQIFKDYPDVDIVYMNPKGEFFTEESYAKNSLPFDENGEPEGKLESVKRAKNTK